MIKIIAKYSGDNKPTDLTYLSQITTRINRVLNKPWGMTEKNRERMRQFDAPENRHAILTLPARLEQLARRSKRPEEAALYMQTAVAIELLLTTALRIQNLSALTIGGHLIETAKRSMHLLIRADETKNGQWIECVIAKPSADLIRRYIKLYRNHLVKSPTDALFPGPDGRPKSIGRLREQITQTVLAQTGLMMTPHQFRHLAAKHYLEDDPGGYGVVRQVLGHKSVTTTERFYCGSDTEHAVRVFDEHLSRKRAAREKKFKKGRPRSST